MLCERRGFDNKYTSIKSRLCFTLRFVLVLLIYAAIFIVEI